MQQIGSGNLTSNFEKTLRSLVSLNLRWIGALSLFILFAATVHAQFGSSLSGTVLDSTGAAISHAAVTLTNSGTQQVWTATTNDTGAYHFSELAPGQYSVSVTATGFKKGDLTQVAIAAESPRSVDVTLQPGGATESVEVTADQVPLLQTSDASVGVTIDSEEIQRLPTVGADPYEVLRTAPGITGDGARSGSGSALLLPNGAGPGGSNSGIFQTENQVQISADGQREADNNFMIDGVSVNSLTYGGAAVVTPNQEAVGQISIVSTSYDASDGRNSGAQIKVVTKSGSNALHGSLFAVYDEPGLNAFDRWGGPSNALPTKVENKARTYAASIGGPIKRNKIFGFASYEGYTIANNTEDESYVETPEFRAAVLAQRAGGVSAGILSNGAVPRIRDVITPSCAGLNLGVNCNVVMGSSGPALDIGSLTPGGASQIGVFPSGDPTCPTCNNQVGGGLMGDPDVENVQLFVPSHSRGNQFNGRGDWFASSKDQIAGTFYITKLDNDGTTGTAGSRPQSDAPFKPLNSAATAIYIHTFSPNWLNEARANSTRFAENGVNDAGTSVDFGIPYVNVQTLPWAIQYGANWASTTPAIFAENTYEVRDMITHSWGSNVMRMGGEVRLEQDNNNLSGEQRPIYAMQGLWTFANDAPIYESIDANPANGGAPLTQRYFRSDDFAGYLQDDWKVMPNLTLNLGLRWEYFTPLRNKGFEINYPVLGPSGQELSGITLQLRNRLWNRSPHNFAPKFGFAYQPPVLNNKAVVRGGAAIAYNHLDVSLFENALEDGPGVASFGLCCASNSGSSGVKYEMGTTTSPSSFPFNPALALGVNPATGFPCEYGSTPKNCISNSESYEVYGAAPEIKQPMSILYSLETQYQLPSNMVATIGYTGSVGFNYARLVNQNFIHSQTGSPVYAAYFAQTDSHQSYNALNLNLTRHAANGLTVAAYYTYSKSLDQVSNGDLADSNGNQTNPANNYSEWGPSDYDVRHHITVSGIYELPHVHSSNAFVKAAANGWQVNGILTYHTAFPWTPVTYNLQTSPLVPGANVVGPTRPLAYYGGAGDSCSNSAFRYGTNFPKGGTAYFDIKAPTTEKNYTYTPGIGRNSFRGPCFFGTDMSFAKQITLDGLDHHTVLRFQANLFNIFNIPELQPITNGNANPGANIQSATFGESQGSDAGRVIEFVARIQF
jgi:hypothetical protein